MGGAPGGEVEGEQQVERLEPAALHGDVQQPALQVYQGLQLHVREAQGHGAQHGLHLLGPLLVMQGAINTRDGEYPHLHQPVHVRHGLPVVDGGRRLGAVQVADVADPLGHLRRYV